MDDKDAILVDLNLMIDRAEKEGKWLYCHYQGLWFSPAELREENNRGNFIWGAVNWTVRDKADFIDMHKRRLDDARAEYDAAMKRTKER